LARQAGAEREKFFEFLAFYRGWIESMFIPAFAWLRRGWLAVDFHGKWTGLSFHSFTIIKLP
jgi:hypothetical protein